MVSINNEFQYLIALGANLGDRRSYLLGAKEAMGRETGNILACAGIYDTAPIGAADQQFLNSALILDSHLSPETLLKALLDIEVNLGRVREVHWGNRTIDLDIVMARRCGETYSIATPSLTIPHPHLLDRDFVLCPGAAIAPEWVHPGTQKTLAFECASRRFNLEPSSW